MDVNTQICIIKQPSGFLLLFSFGIHYSGSNTINPVRLNIEILTQFNFNQDPVI
jgi:hypothetical protein